VTQKKCRLHKLDKAIQDTKDIEERYDSDFLIQFHVLVQRVTSVPNFNISV
jgi:hypothetical protein